VANRTNARASAGRQATVLAICLAVGIGLAGCIAAAGAPESPAQSAPAGATTTPTAPSAPVAPELVPAGTATDNQPFFDSVIAAVLATEPNPGGRGYLDALAGAGFDKAQMEVTADTTTKGEPADSIHFSVRVNDECIVGQNGPSSGGYRSIVAPLLGSGRCLVGATRQIDW
jgi:hypothetical protein